MCQGSLSRNTKATFLLLLSCIARREKDVVRNVNSSVARITARDYAISQQLWALASMINKVFTHKPQTN